MSLLPGIQSQIVQTSRLKTHILSCGEEYGVPLVFVHGNLSAATYFEELMLAIPDDYLCIAVDLRGYGNTEDLVIDATQGARTWSEDLAALFDALNISHTHLIGWSAGSASIMQFMIDYTRSVNSLTLIAPVSPFGFGGSKDKKGSACYSDFSGSGAGCVIDSEFVQRLIDNDQTTESVSSPLNIIKNSFVNAPFQFNREKDFLTASLMQKFGEKRYPGDYSTSPNWPYTSPGQWGPINAVSAKYLDVSGIVNLPCKPPILWVRGDCDTIISDRSSNDPAILGELNVLPNWPGNQVYPAQPMVSQMRNVLECYKKKTGIYFEINMKGVGHSPFLEKPDEFLNILLNFLGNEMHTYQTGVI